MTTTDRSVVPTHERQKRFELLSLTDRQCGPRNASPAQLHRREYLQALVRGEMPTLIGIYGQSASGKSTAIKLLHRTLGIEPSTRFITRPSRSDDGWFETQWDLSQVSLPAGSRASKDQSSPESFHLAPGGTLFAIFNYDNYDGTSAREIVERLHTAGPYGASILMGKLVDLPNFHEAVSNVLPLFPLVPCRLMVDLFQLRDRLERRQMRGNESRPGEVAERLRVLEYKFIEDQAQVPHYSALYGLRLLNAPLQSEVERFNLENAVPLDEDGVRAWVGPAIQEAKEQSAVLAKDVLRPRVFPAIRSPIRAVAMKLLQDTLVPRAQRFGISEIYLTGEIGVAAYLAETSLIPVIPIDRVAFTVTSREDDTARIGDLLATIMLHSSGEARPALDDAYPHATTDLRGAAAIEWSDPNVTLEGRMTTQIRPSESVFCYELRCDHADQILARTVRLPDGSHIAVVPPEHLLFENLLLCRAPHRGDPASQRALGLLATQNIDPHVLHRLVFQQEIDGVIDAACMDTLHRTDFSHLELTFGEFCRRCLHNPDQVLNGVSGELKERLVDLTKLCDTPRDNTNTSSLSLSAVKQLMLLAHFRRALAGLRNYIEEDHTTFAGALPDTTAREQLIQKIALVDRAFEAFMHFEVGRGDIFVRRDRDQRVDSFFRRSPAAMSGKT